MNSSTPTEATTGTKPAAGAGPDVAAKRSGARVDLTQGSIQGHILRMLGPFSLAVIALISTGLVDSFFLGNLGGEENPKAGTIALAALGIAFPLTFIGNSANIGLGAGTMSAISRALGEGETDRAQRHGAAAILFGLLVMSVLVTLMILAVPSVTRLMGASGDVRAGALSYLAISLPGLVIVSVASMCNNTLRAHGEALLPSSIMILGALLNMAIDPFLIFGIGPFPRMEVAGAALATVIGNGVAALYGLYLVRFVRDAVHFRGITIATLRHAWATIAAVGVPAMGTNIIVPVGTFFATVAVTRLTSEVGLAAFSLASRLELLSVGLLYALSACIGSVTGQNGGAGRTDRVREAFGVSYKICLIWSTLMAVVLALAARPLLSLFSNDPALIEMAVPYFYIVPVTVFAYGFVFVTAAGFNALGRPKYGFVFTFLRSLILYAPLVAIGAWTYGLFGAFVGIAVSNMLSGLAARYWALNRAPMTARKS
ncbi:MATE family efflux transporter [uncultured Algimonas sp.]|uniref:MATE family efflux transporter n=1 Tax=uncultured Algimonas sp. TaxID=1547920 RepID=UPI00260F0CDC|nr:MATE family efflux transporter [uncultured Algimonas sp.]